MNLYTITRGNGGVIAWTDEQVAYIINKYTEEAYTLKQLGNEFHCSYGTIRNLLHRKGIETQGNKQGYPRRSNYFTNIDSPDKAYWLGFMYADGTTAANTYSISLTSTDLEHIYKFKEAIGAKNHKITTVNDTRWESAKPYYVFSIKDKELHDSLIKWGCVPNKSLKLTKIPNIPRDYTSHFIRGYFDGDGSLHYLKGTNNYRIAFVGTEDFLNDLQNEFGTHLSLGYGSAGKAYQLQISGRHQVIRILDYLYKASSDATRLERKYKTYLDCSEWAHRH